MVTFHQGDTVQISEFPRRIFAQDSVVGTPVEVDSVSWSEMESKDGLVGHVFSLTLGSRPVFKVEATLSGETLQRVAVVQSCYSPLLVAAGFSPESSLLIYEPPAAHIKSMRELHKSLEEDDELGYVPTSELVVTRALDDIELRAEHTPKGDAARRDWKITKKFLRDLSTCTANCIDKYTLSEIDRTNAHELRESAKKWRDHIA